MICCQTAATCSTTLCKLAAVNCADCCMAMFFFRVCWVQSQDWALTYWRPYGWAALSTYMAVHILSALLLNVVFGVLCRSVFDHVVYLSSFLSFLILLFNFLQGLLGPEPKLGIDILEALWVGCSAQPPGKGREAAATAFVECLCWLLSQVLFCPLCERVWCKPYQQLWTSNIRFFGVHKP